MRLIVHTIDRTKTETGAERTTVRLKGCFMNCKDCSDPSIRSARPQIYYNAELCTDCGACEDACFRGVHQMKDGRHVYDPTRCRGCEDCRAVCKSGAITPNGTVYEHDAVLPMIEGDELWLTGGEPLMYIDACREMLKYAKEKGMKTTIFSTGYVDPGCLFEFLPYTDAFVWLLHDGDAERLKANTGADFDKIRANIEKADAEGVASEIRLTGATDDASRAPIEAIAASLKHCRGITTGICC